MSAKPAKPTAADDRRRPAKPTAAEPGGAAGAGLPAPPDLAPSSPSTPPGQQRSPQGRTQPSPEPGQSSDPDLSTSLASPNSPASGTKAKHASLPSQLLSRVGSSSTLNKANSGASLTRTVSTSSVESTSEKRLSVTKADNVTVSLVGGTPMRRHGSLRVKRSSIFTTYRDSFVSIDNGEISFAENELDLQKRQTHSLMDVREVKVVAPGSNQFTLRLGPASQGKALAKVVTLKAETPKEAVDWVATVQHELRNQILVCRESIKKVAEAGHHDRLEPLYKQRLDLCRVVSDGADDADTAEALEEYADWCEAHGRLDEAATMKKQARAIRRRVGPTAGDSRVPSTEAELSSSDPEDTPPSRSKSPPGLPPRAPTKSPLQLTKPLA